MSTNQGRGRVAAVVVTHNRLSKLKLSLQRTMSLPFNYIIVINNNSTDGTYEYLESLSDARLRTFHEPDNTGGAGGFCRGFHIAAYDTDAEWLVCYDDDAFPSDEALSRFASLRINDDIVAVAAAVYYPDGRICRMNTPGRKLASSLQELFRNGFQSTSKIGISTKAYREQFILEVDFASFVGLFVRCATVRSFAGLPRSELFIYRDDSIYTLNITRQGKKIIFVPWIHFVHDCMTDHANVQADAPLWKLFYTVRNDIPFFRQLSGSFFLVILPILFYKWLSQSVKHKDRLHFLIILFVAIVDGMRNDFTRELSQVLMLANEARLSEPRK